MKDKDRAIEEYNKRFMKKILRSIVYTFFIFLFTIFGLYFIISLIFGSGGDTSLLISFCIGLIFTIFYCTLTIIEEIKKLNKHL